MFRTVSIIARFCRMTPSVHSRVLSPLINNVRFKYQSRGSGDKTGRRKMYNDDEDDAGESTTENEYNLLDDK